MEIHSHMTSFKIENVSILNLFGFHFHYILAELLANENVGLGAMGRFVTILHPIYFKCQHFKHLKYYLAEQCLLLNQFKFIQEQNI